MRWVTLLPAFALLCLALLVLLTVKRENRVMLAFRREGGFAGIREEVTVYFDGSVVYKLEGGGEYEDRLSESSFAKVRRLLELVRPYCGKGYEAAKGAADYFIYTLEAGACSIRWVTPQLSSEKLPQPILDMQKALEEIIYRVRAREHG